MRVKLIICPEVFLLLTMVSLVSLTKASLALTEGHIYVDPSTGDFLDSQGRQRLFRGVNFVRKGEPYYTPSLLDPKRQESLAVMGFNTVRLGVMWTGWEPEMGQRNDSYVDLVEKIVDELGEHGVYSILEMHQDALWKAGEEENRGYWGLPPWIKHKLPKPENAYPWPLEENASWWCYYFSEEIREGFQNLFDNVEGVADDMANFWRQVAQTFKGKDHVLGYEFMNEPFAGDVGQDLSLLLPGVTGKRNLVKFYDRLNKAVREVDDETLVFWEPVTWSYMVPSKANWLFDLIMEQLISSIPFDLMIPVLHVACPPTSQLSKEDKIEMLSKFFANYEDWKNNIDTKHDASQLKSKGRPAVMGTGFNTVPGGDHYRNRTVLSWHYYCWALELSYSHNFDWQETICQGVMAPSVFSNVRQRAEQELGGSATMLTEFGQCVPKLSSPDAPSSKECRFLLNKLDEDIESWVYWDVSDHESIFWDENNEINWDTASFFVRPYSMATAGRILAMKFDIFKAEFELEFETDANIRAPTVIFVPEIHFGHEFCVNLSPGLEHRLESRQIVQVQVEDGGDEVDRRSWVRIFKC